MRNHNVPEGIDPSPGHGMLPLPSWVLLLRVFSYLSASGDHFEHPKMPKR